MSTKNNPGDYDYYANADPDEEMFILLARDRHASALVSLWAMMREKEGEDPDKVAEARACAERMAAGAVARGKVAMTLEVLLRMAASLAGETLQVTAPAPVVPAEGINAPPVEGDIVVAGRGIPGRLLRIFKDDPSLTEAQRSALRESANVLFAGQVQPATLKYDTLRRALPEEVVAYRKSAQL